jgi:hypothetical protein
MSPSFDEDAHRSESESETQTLNVSLRKSNGDALPKEVSAEKPVLKVGMQCDIKNFYLSKSECRWTDVYPDNFN